MKLLNFNQMCCEIHVKVENLCSVMNVEHVWTLILAEKCLYMEK